MTPTDKELERKQPGHCLHPPKCIGVDPVDERDPLGCCNCGTRALDELTRLREENTRLLTAIKDASDVFSQESFDEGDLEGVADSFLAALSAAKEKP